MDTLKNWSAKRAGGAITITHSTGKVTNIDRVVPTDWGIIAVGKDEKRYALAERQTDGQ